VTGEKWSDAYSGGVFKGVKPTSNFKPGSGWGAFQLGLRYAKIDATGINVYGGGSRIQSGRSGYNASGVATASVENTTEVSATSGASGAGTTKSGTRGGKLNADVYSWGIGINWLLNPNAKVMLDYTRTNFGGQTCSIDTDVRPGTKCSDHEDVVSVRAQYNF
jgi:phosphate-selective porin OprO/OprP